MTDSTILSSDLSHRPSLANHPCALPSLPLRLSSLLRRPLLASVLLRLDSLPCALRLLISFAPTSCWSGTLPWSEQSSQPISPRVSFDGASDTPRPTLLKRQRQRLCPQCCPSLSPRTNRALAFASRGDVRNFFFSVHNPASTLCGSPRFCLCGLSAEVLCSSAELPSK